MVTDSVKPETGSGMGRVERSSALSGKTSMTIEHGEKTDSDEKCEYLGFEDCGRRERCLCQPWLTDQDADILDGQLRSWKVLLK